MSAPPPNLADPVTVLIAVAAALGVRMTADLSGYSIIILAAVGGAVYALIADETPRSRAMACLFVVGRVGLTVLLGGLVAKWATQATGFDWRWLVGPLAGFVAAVGPGWFIDQAKSLWSKRTGASP
jgi:MFS family permease